jgi:hypothetical protein
MNNLV